MVNHAERIAITNTEAHGVASAVPIPHYPSDAVIDINKSARESIPE